MVRKKSHSEFIAEITPICNERYKILSEYRGCKEKIQLKCNVCGRKWQNSPTHLLRGQGCPFCVGKHKNDETFLKEVNKKFGNEYKVLSKYVNAKTKITVIKKSCKHKYEISPDNLLRGKGCPKCRYNTIKLQRTNTVGEIKQKINDVLGVEYDYLCGYENSKGRIKIIHTRCGKEYEISYGTLLQGGGHCVCEKREITLKKLEKNDRKFNGRIACRADFQKFIDNNCYGEYDIVGKYTKSVEPIMLRHNVCGCLFEVTPHNFKNGVRCKKCNEYRGERRVKDYLLSKSVFFEEQVRFDDCRYKKPLPFDFYLPIQNILIEFDGEQHDRPVARWGGAEAFKLQRKRDEIKNNYCKDKGITLIRIKYYDDIEEKLEQLF